MVQTENAEWEEFSALLDDVVPDTSDSAQHDNQSDASYDPQTYAQAQDELQSGYTYEDDSDLEEVEVDQFAMKAEMEAEAGTTALHHNSTHEALATAPDVAASQDVLPSGSSSTATNSAEPQSEAAANRARVTERGYLARRRALRKSASVQTAKDETSTRKKAASKQASSRTRGAPSQGQHIAAASIPNAGTTLPSTPSPAAAAIPPPQTVTQPSAAPGPARVPAPSASSSTLIARPARSSSRTATSVATLPPPPPLPVGAAGRLQLWEGTLTHGILLLKAEYRVELPPARPPSAPVVGATSAGAVHQAGARHQSAPVASTSSGKRSRGEEDRGERVVKKRAKANKATTQSQQQRQPPVSSAVSAPRPQWIPYSAQQPGDSMQREHLSASQPSGLPAQQNVSSHQGQQMHRIAPPPPTAPPSTSTLQVARQMSGAARNIDIPGRRAAYAVAPPQSQRPIQPMPVAGPSRRASKQEQSDSGLQHPGNRAQMYAMPELGGWNDQAAVPRQFARAAPSTSRGVGQNAIVPQQPLPATPEAGPSRGTYQQPYNGAGVQRLYDQPASGHSNIMPVPSGWNDPAAIPRTFARAGSLASTMQPEGQSIYRRVPNAPVAYAVRPQQQMGRPERPMYGGGGEQLPSVDAPGSQPVYNQPYAPPMPLPAGWNSSVQLQAMSGRETVPAYLTMYAPPNYPPPGWNPQPQALVYEQEPSAQSFSSRQGSMSSANGYGYGF